MTRVWLPDSPEAFGGLPPGLEADVWDGGEDLPPSADEVEFAVFPFGKNPEVLRKIVALPNLKTIQILSAGADHILPDIPANITLCNARGAHTPATAEWTAGVIIASIRNFRRFAAGQQAGHWDPAVSDLIATGSRKGPPAVRAAAGPASRAEPRGAGSADEGAAEGEEEKQQ